MFNSRRRWSVKLLILIYSPCVKFCILPSTLYIAHDFVGDLFDIILLSPPNSIVGDIVMLPFVCGWMSEWVGACVCHALPCGHDTDYIFSPITFNIHMLVVDDDRKNPIDFGSWGQRSRSVLALCVLSPGHTARTLLERCWSVPGAVKTIHHRS